MKISASLLSSDLLNLEREIKDLTNAGVDALHVDIMDGHFVPNIAFGIDIIKKISDISTLPINIHLMINNPERFIDIVSSSSKVDYIIVHGEECRNVIYLFEKIKSNGIKVGLAINPRTQVIDITEYLNLVDMVLVMGVHPGFGGQALIHSTIAKIGQLKDIRKDLIVGIDGGVNKETINIVKKENPDILVVGSYLFDKTNSEDSLQSMKEKLQILRGI